MEAKLYRTLYRHVHSVAHTQPRPHEWYDDQWIVMVHLWSTLHQRPAYWACDPVNWPEKLLDDRPLPSASRLSRRMRTVGVQQLLERVINAAAELFPVPLVKVIDSKPLCVGAYSKDSDAKRGRVAAGVMARGYRLHAITHGRMIQCWTLRPMNQHDSVCAPVLLGQLKQGGYVLGDNAYDTNLCHQAAAAVNHQLVAPPRAVNKGVRDAKYNCPQRLRALDLLDSPLQACGLRGGFGQALYNLRQRVESGFGGLAMMQMDHLPPWVRGPRRVASWCAAKILIYLCRTAQKQRLMTFVQ